jgi:hypothetical protein
MSEPPTDPATPTPAAGTRETSTASSVVVPDAADAAVAGAANAAATWTRAGVAGASHVLSGVWWSYSAAPTGGRLTVSDGTITYRDLDVTAAGPGFLPCNPPLKMPAGRPLTLTLAAAGVGVAGKIQPMNNWTE